MQRECTHLRQLTSLLANVRTPTCLKPVTPATQLVCQVVTVRRLMLREAEVLITATLCLPWEPIGDRLAFEGNLVSIISCVNKGLDMLM